MQKDHLVLLHISSSTMREQKPWNNVDFFISAEQTNKPHITL